MADKKAPKPKTLEPMKSSLAIERKLSKTLARFSNSVNRSVFKYILSELKIERDIPQAFFNSLDNLQARLTQTAKDIGSATTNGFIASIEKLVNASYKRQGLEFSIIGRSEIVEKTIFKSYSSILDLIVSIPSEIVGAYKQELLNGVGDFNRERIAQIAENVGGVSRRKAELIARDQTHKATTNYAMARASSLGFDYYVWDTSHDERVSTGKGGHRQLQGRIYRYDKDTAIVDSYGNVGHCGSRVNCLAKGQSIDFGNFALRIFRADRVKKSLFVKIKTEFTEFVVTRKHKVLTRSGWVTADRIKKGDNIIKIANKAFNINEIDFNNNGIIISKLFDFIHESDFLPFSNTLAFKRVGIAGKFDKDIRLNEKVNIIEIESLLRDGVKTFIAEFGKKLNFASTEMRIQFETLISGSFSAFSSVNASAITAFLSSDFFVSFFSDFLPVSSSRIFKPNEVGFTTRANFITEFFKTAGYTTSINAEVFAHFKDAIASDIGFFKFFYINVFIVGWYNFSSSQFIFMDKFPDYSSFTPDLLSDISGTSTLINEVVNDAQLVRIKSHIYSLETKCGYYTIKSLINKNCRCVPLTLMLEPNQKLKLVKDAYAGDYYVIES